MVDHGHFIFNCGTDHGYHGCLTMVDKVARPWLPDNGGHLT